MPSSTERAGALAPPPAAADPRFVSLVRVASELAGAALMADVLTLLDASLRELFGSPWIALYRAEADGSFARRLLTAGADPRLLSDVVSGEGADLLQSLPAVPMVRGTRRAVPIFPDAALAIAVEDASRANRRLGWLLVGERSNGVAFDEADAQVLSLVACLLGPRLAYADLVADHNQASLNDGLTALGNRRAFDQRIEEEIARSNRSGEPVSLVLVDVDNLSEYGGRCGAAEGERMLRAVADAVRASIRGSDVAFRHGDVKIAVLLTNADSVGARIAAERIRARVERLGLDTAPPLAASVGVATLKKGFHTPVSLASLALIKKADEALHHARRGGGNRIIAG